MADVSMFLQSKQVWTSPADDIVMLVNKGCVNVQKYHLSHLILCVCLLYMPQRALVFTAKGSLWHIRIDKPASGSGGVSF